MTHGAHAQGSAPPAPSDADAQDEADAADAEAEGDEAKAPAASPSKAGAPPAAPPEDEEMSDAEMEAELAADEAAAAALINKAPAKGKGVIWGVVRDTKFNESVIEAQVSVVGRKEKAFTDIEGRYRLELPPGVYRIRVSFELHRPSRVDEVRVKDGVLTQLNVKLVPDESAVEEVVIEEEVDRSSSEGQGLERKRSGVVSDGVGRAEIARTPDRNAAEAATRVVGATIVGGRFVYVRGLGERYTNALLNGTPMPSPEPDRQTVPLDLFPALVLDSVSITKQFTPESPGDFAGGSVRIRTREFPKERLLQISLNGSFDTASTFRDGLATHGSSTDFLGFDDGVRQLPGGLPLTKIASPDATVDEQVKWGREVNSYMSARHRTILPNHGGSIVVGDSWKLGSDKKLGAILALNYGHSYQLRNVSSRNYLVRAVPGGGSAPVVSDTADGVQGLDLVRWGTLGTVAVELSRSHKLALTGFRSQGSDDSATEIEGFNDNAGGTFRNVHLEYISRALNFGQLRGEHRFKALNDGELDWHVDYSTAARDQPDTRDLQYRRSTAGMPLSYTWISGASSGSHFYSEQSEHSLAGGLDYTQPIVKSPDAESKIKVGGLLTTRSRDFTARRFVLEPELRPRGEPPKGFDSAQVCEGAWSSSCPDKLFRVQNITSNGLLLRETTQPYDGYKAGLDVFAGYAMLDAQPSKPLRVIAGARVEKTKQNFSAFDPLVPGVFSASSTINSTDVLPALSMVFAASERANARFGISRTIARPQLREISPFFSSGYTLDLPVQGNPDLKLTKIWNADLRFEAFPSLREVLAFSFFFKHFTYPIEEVVRLSSAGPTLTYGNAPKANLIGIELEARKTLSFLSASLKEFTVIGNLTLADSNVVLGQGRGLATNPARPMALQSPYVINAALDWEHVASKTDIRILYNVYGARITTVGAYGLPDAYEMPRHLLDVTIAQKLSKHFDLKLAAQNLLAQKVNIRYKGQVGYENVNGEVRRLATDPLIRSYDTGSIFTLTGTYTY